MDDRLTVAELEKRWQKALAVTQTAVARHPRLYRELKSLAADVVAKPLDIRQYRPTVDKLRGLLDQLDPDGRGSIFYFFNTRICPSSIWDVCWLRMECTDLLAHLKVFDQWRLQSCGLKVVK